MKKKLAIFLFTLLLVMPFSIILYGCENQHDHDFGEWQTRTPATCTAAEIRFRSCNCGEQEEIVWGDPLAHNMTGWVEVSPATCTVAQVLERCCTTCTTQKERKDGIAAFGHEESEWLTCYDDNEIETGYKEKKCLVCNERTNYSEKEYTISFNSNGGTFVEPITDFFNKSVSRPANPQKEGFIFEGWYLDNNTFEREFFDINNTGKIINSNITLYAKWRDAESQTFVENFVEYRDLGNGTYEIVKGVLIENGKFLDIFPSKYKIVSIADNAFKDWHVGTVYSGFPAVVSLVIPASVKTIGKNAFNNALIYDITFEVNSQLEEIGDFAFYNNELSNIVLRLPEGLRTLGDNAFAATNPYGKIEIVYLPETLQNFGADVFDGQDCLNKIISRTSHLEENDYYKYLIEKCEFQGLTNGEFTQVKDMLFWKADDENFARLNYYNISGLYTQEIFLVGTSKIFGEVLVMPEFDYDYIIESYTFYNLSGIHGVIFADNSNVIGIETEAFGKLTNGYGLPITIGDTVLLNYTEYPNFLFSSNIDWNNVELQQDWLYLSVGTNNFDVYCTVSVFGEEVLKVECFLKRLNASLSIDKNNNMFGVLVDADLSGKLKSEDYKFERLLFGDPLLLENFL